MESAKGCSDTTLYSPGIIRTAKSLQMENVKILVLYTDFLSGGSDIHSLKYIEVYSFFFFLFINFLAGVQIGLTPALKTL